MGIGISEAITLFLGGVIIFSSLALIHFASTYNPYNRSFAFSSAIATGAAAAYLAGNQTNYSNYESFERAINSAIIGFLELLPIFLAVSTLLLLRISLLTNRSVDASS